MLIFFENFCIKKGNRKFIKYHINEGEEINLRRVGIITETKLLELTSDPVFKAFMTTKEKVCFLKMAQKNICL